MKPPQPLGTGTLVILSDAMLESRSTPNLRYILRKAQFKTKQYLSGLGPRCCGACNEYIGDDWEGDVGVHIAPFRDYLARIKAILDSRAQNESGARSTSHERLPRAEARTHRTLPATARHEARALHRL